MRTRAKRESKAAYFTWPGVLVGLRSLAREASCRSDEHSVRFRDGAAYHEF